MRNQPSCHQSQAGICDEEGKLVGEPFEDRVERLDCMSDAKVHKKVAPQLAGGSLTFQTVQCLPCASGVKRER